MNLELKVLEENLKEEARQENGCCFLIYSWIVKIFQPFSHLGL
jgi:hypothetical protein